MSKNQWGQNLKRTLRQRRTYYCLCWKGDGGSIDNGVFCYSELRFAHGQGVLSDPESVQGYSELAIKCKEIPGGNF